MVKDNLDLVQATEQYVRSLFNNKSNKEFVYHNLNHTLEVVRFSGQIADYYRLPEDARHLLILSAWFHDVGYLRVDPQDHEEESARIARDFLSGMRADEELIVGVEECIRATRMPQSPSSLVEQILCDADLYHLGTDKFFERNQALREEVNSFREEKVSKKEWRAMNVEFMERHRYFTDYCREKLEPGKQKNLDEIQARQSKKEKKVQQENPVTPIQQIAPATITTDEDSAAKETEKMKEERKLKTKEQKTERGVVAMFRIMSENHVNLSQMADSKANIMISINTIVISILVSVLLGKLQFYPQYIIPTIILISVCLGAIVFSILATRPNVSEGTFSREDIANKKINLLFFGNFYNMELAEYDWAMKEMMKDKEYLYGSMIKDIYFLGVVLARKYKLLRIAYNIFMFGLIAALLAFGVAMAVSG